MPFNRPRISLGESFLPTTHRPSFSSSHRPFLAHKRHKCWTVLFAFTLTFLLFHHSPTFFLDTLTSNTAFSREGALTNNTDQPFQLGLFGWGNHKPPPNKPVELEGEYDPHSIGEPEDVDDLFMTIPEIIPTSPPKPISKESKIEQIQAMLYYLLDGGILPAGKALDLNQPISLASLTAQGTIDSDAALDKDWRAHLGKRYPLVVFSKSYCPYSKKAKTILNSLSPAPEPLVIEVDLRPDAASLKTLLGHLTGRSTFPNVLVSFESIGGGDDVEILYSEGGLVKLLRKAGIRVRT